MLAADDGRVPVADAVLYLMRHTHASDVRFLESFHDDELAHGTPMNSVGVLVRADEIGSCRLDALEVADRIARRYEADPRLRRLCPDRAAGRRPARRTPRPRCGRPSTPCWPPWPRPRGRRRTSCC